MQHRSVKVSKRLVKYLCCFPYCTSRLSYYQTCLDSVALWDLSDTIGCRASQTSTSRGCVSEGSAYIGLLNRIAAISRRQHRHRACNLLRLVKKMNQRLAIIEDTKYSNTCNTVSSNRCSFGLTVTHTFHLKVNQGAHLLHTLQISSRPGNRDTVS